MKIYKMNHLSTIVVEFVHQTIKKMNNAIEKLREMNLQNLYTKLLLAHRQRIRRLAYCNELLHGSLAIIAAIKYLLMREIADGSVTSIVACIITQSPRKDYMLVPSCKKHVKLYLCL